MDDRIGQQLGSYHLLRVLGQGAQARVYLGEHQYLERPAAIKVLHTRLSPDRHEAFRREARTIAKLDHPHIIGVYDFGIQDDLPYLAMPYSPHGSLRSRHPRGTPLSFEQIIIYVKQIASALHYAHEQHVIHRDIKPENLLLNAKNEAVLSDFGLAVIAPTLDSLSTQDPAGTPLYMAPEQIRGKPCAASDQYALGVLVYEWLCRQPPFHGTLYEVFNQHLHFAPPSLRARLPQLPPAVEGAVLGALSKDPQQRFSTVQDFAITLIEALSATQPLAREGSALAHTSDEATSPLIAASMQRTRHQEQPNDITSPRVQHTDNQQKQTASVSAQHTPSSQTGSKPSLAQLNRQRILRRVRSFWISGVLEQSLHGAALIALGLQEQPDAVANPWHLVLQPPDTAPRPLPAGTRITQVYDDAESELLILGAPGAGKTTLLLSLARDLLDRAEHDQQYPIPVVFNLSSWAIKQQPLVDWLVEELSTKYQVPRKLGHTLVETDQLLLLLDGLDEVAPVARTACIKAINGYREEHGMLPLVVCSRATDYLAEHRRLLLRSAVAVQSLTQQQVDAYLIQAGEPLCALRIALRQDALLRELTTTPLMLSILTLTYHGKPVEELLRGTSLPERQRQVFEQYVGRMLTRRGPLKAGTPGQMVHWLTYLATQMRKHNQTVFYLEHLQPDWLTGVQQHNYVWLALQLPAVLIGLLASFTVAYLINTASMPSLDQMNPTQYAALGGLLGWLFSRPSSAGGSQQEQIHQSPKRWHHFSRGIPLGIIIGLVFGLSFGPRALEWYLFDWLIQQGYGLSEWLRDGPVYGYVIGISSLGLSWILPAHPSASAPPTTRPTRPWSFLVRLLQTIHGQRTWRVIAVLAAGYALSYVLSEGSSYRLDYALIKGLLTGLNAGLIIGIISILISLLLEAQAKGIALTDRLRWTWRSLMRSLLSPKHVRETFLVTGGLGLGLGLSEGLGFGLSQALICGLLYWLLQGLFQGVSSEQIEDHARHLPNQGIRRSLYNSVILALISGILIGVIDRLSFILGSGLNYTLNFTFFGPSKMLKWGIEGLRQGMLFFWPSINTFILAVCFGLLVCASRGGLAVLRHFIIRQILQRAGVVPHHYVRFLDEAASCILLQKVGGGYSFVHRTLLDYFADVVIHSPADASEVTATSDSASTLSSTSPIAPVHKEEKTSAFPVSSREPSAKKKNRVVAYLRMMARSRL